MSTRLVHNKIGLALHRLRDPIEGSDLRPLLMLHGLGEATPATVPDRLSAWRGPIFGLDFTGHGDSDIPAGGGYYCEILMGDADAALAALGQTTVFGRGLGAYIALLIAGARPETVRGAILEDGPGLDGGGPEPGSPMAIDPGPAVRTPDPLALVELSRDVRPADYAQSYVRQATHLSGIEVPITVVARNRPSWLASVVDEPGVAVDRVDVALARYADE